VSDGNIYNLHEFKKELKAVYGYGNTLLDPWGSIHNAAFEACGQLYDRGAEIPEKWNYKHQSGEATDPENYWHVIFKNAETQVLLEIGEFCHRYIQWIKNNPYYKRKFAY
jgi:hypothetical protein